MQPARLGWLARWFGRKPRQPAPAPRPRPAKTDAGLFTAEAYPDLSPEARAFFNTPVEDCDPETLQLVLAVLARHIADAMGPALGMDAEALFSTLCGRLRALPGATGPDAAPPEAPAQAPAALPATPTNAAPDAPPTSPNDTMRQATPDAACPVERDFRDNRKGLGRNNRIGRADACITVMAGEGRPSTTFLGAEGQRRGWPASAGHDDLCASAVKRRTGFVPGPKRFDRLRLFHDRSRPFVRQRGSRSRRGLPGAPQRLPLRKLCYAARAGPP